MTVTMRCQIFSLASCFGIHKHLEEALNDKEEIHAEPDGQRYPEVAVVGVERRDFRESEGCGYEVEDCAANQTADGKPDEAGKESRIEAAGHEGEDANSNNTGETDQGDHEQAIAPNFRTAWLHLPLGK